LKNVKQDHTSISTGLGEKLKQFWQKLKHGLKKLFGGNVRGNYFNSADGPRVKKGNRRQGGLTPPKSSGPRHDYNDYARLSPTRSLIPPDDESNSDQPRKNPNSGYNNDFWNQQRERSQGLDHNKGDGDKNKYNDPLTRKLNDEFENPGMKDIDAENNAVKQGGPVLAAQLQKLNSEEKAKVHQDQSGLGGWKENPDGILVIVDKIKQAIAAGSTSINLTEDLAEIGHHHTPTVIGLSPVVGRLEITAKKVEIELRPSGNILLPESNFVLDPNGVESECYGGPGGLGNFVEFKFTNVINQYHHITIVVNKEDAYTFADYVGLSSETDRLVADVLPGNLSAEQTEHYSELLDDIKSSEGLNSTMTPADFVTDQFWKIGEEGYTNGNKEVLDSKGIKTTVKKIGTKRQCWDATKMMIQNNGHTSGSSSRVYQVAMEDKATKSKLITNQEQYKKGIKSIFDHLESGRAVQIGVNYVFGNTEANVGNNNLSTDHFVVITSAKYDENGNLYLRFTTRGHHTRVKARVPTIDYTWWKPKMDLF
jgi:hypothetical protein